MPIVEHLLFCVLLLLLLLWLISIMLVADHRLPAPIQQIHIDRASIQLLASFIECSFHEAMQYGRNYRGWLWRRDCP